MAKMIGPASEKQAMYIQATQDVVVFGGGRNTQCLHLK